MPIFHYILFLLIFAAPLSAGESQQKVVVLGIDALDTRLMEKWMAEGRLPNFKRLAAQGHYSPLQTSYPPMSPAAWATMTTGLNPGRTGIFGFLKRKEGSYEPELSLVHRNEQPVAGGGIWFRLGASLVIALALSAFGLLLGRVWHRLLSKRGSSPRVHRLVPAVAVMAMVLLSAVPGWASPLVVGTTFGLLMTACVVFALGARALKLNPASWLIPLLALTFAGFSLVNRLPESAPKPITARSGENFWKTASDAGIRARVIGAPVAWPANPDLNDKVKLTTGLATPDAMATFHTYTLFTEPHHELAGGLTEMSGRIERLEFNSEGAATATLQGPPALFDRDRWAEWQSGKLAVMPREEIEFTVMRTEAGVRLLFREADVVGEPVLELKPGEWIRHARVIYDLGNLERLHGTVSFKLLAGGKGDGEGGGEVRLYATPVNFDPLSVPAAFRISHPDEFAPWLVEQYGMFQTLGWAEATSALQDGAIDDATFLETCVHSFDEKRAQILGLLAETDWDLLVAFTYEIDRVCHMMWRHMDSAHPNHDPTAPDAFVNAIRDFYERYDGLLGEVLAALPENAILIVCSDHGFAPFYRAVNLNRWLLENGYLALKEKTGAPTMAKLFDRRSEYYGPYDWANTRAYALGLSKIYINLKGREPEGIVEEAEAEALKDKIIAGLMALRDGEKPVISGVWKREEIWEGPRAHEAGDLQIGYAWGYRVSWQTSLGGADEPIIFDNLRNWSGDHCSFDPKLVPGVVFSNRKWKADGPLRLVDIAPTVLALFELEPPGERSAKDGVAWR